MGERYEEAGVFVTYRAEAETLARFKSKLAK
jgi:hypothetical protein